MNGDEVFEVGKELRKFLEGAMETDHKEDYKTR
jgi:hypothetical protein